MCIRDRDIIYRAEKSTAPSNAQQYSILTTKMSSLKIEIQNTIDVLTTETTVDSLSTGQCKIYTEMLSSVTTQLGDPYSKLVDSILPLAGTDTATVHNGLEEFRQQQSKRLVDIQMKLAKLTKDPEEGTRSSHHGTTSTTMGRGAMEMAKCKPPSFSGKTIEYPEFKRSWTKVAGRAWDDDN